MGCSGEKVNTPHDHGQWLPNIGQDAWWFIRGSKVTTTGVCATAVAQPGRRIGRSGHMGFMEAPPTLVPAKDSVCVLNPNPESLGRKPEFSASGTNSLAG